MALWINAYDAETDVGEIGFLVRSVDFNRRNPEDRFSIQRRPEHTNQSHEQRLRGWCGTTNNHARYAEGLARVVRITPGNRAMVLRVDRPHEVQQALERLGWPGLSE